MGLFSSMWRMVKSVFGLAEGATERATDALVAGSPEAIKAQFRKTKEDWIRDYNQMRDAIAELIRIRETRIDEIKKLNSESDQIETKMAGAIELFKQKQDPRYREAYAQLGNRNEQLETRIKELNSEVEEQKVQIERFKTRLMELQRQIEGLSKEEAETVVDMVSSQKIRELNDRLSGISVDSQSKNLEAIRTARQKAKAISKISSEMSGADKNDFEADLAKAGSGSKYLDGFDQAVGKKEAPKAYETAPAALPASSSKNGGDIVDVEIQKLFEGVEVGKK